MTHPVLPAAPQLAAAGSLQLQCAALVPDLTRLARFLAGDSDRAQDLVQDTMLRLLHRQDVLAEVEDLRGYARTILRNLHRRRSGLGREDTVETLPEEPCAPEVFPVLALQELFEVLEAMPPEQSSLLRLVMEGETSPRDIACRTGLPEGTVMSRLARARAHLRREMGLGPRDRVADLY